MSIAGVLRRGRHVGRLIARTRTTARTGSTFMSGVSRRVHAPVGSVIKVARIVLHSQRSPERRRFLLGVRDSKRTLLSVVGSMLSFSGVRSKGVRLILRPCSALSLFRSLGLAVRGRVDGYPLRLVCRVSRAVPYLLCKSTKHVQRMVAGLIDGTVGCARRKRIHFSIRIRGGSCSGISLCCRIRSANVKVHGRSRRVLFSSFRHISLGGGHHVRKANLNLAVSGGFIGVVKKAVNMRDRCKGKDGFCFYVSRAVVSSAPVSRVGCRRQRGDIIDGRTRDLFATRSTRVLLMSSGSLGLLITRRLLGPLRLRVSATRGKGSTITVMRRQRCSLMLVSRVVPIVSNVRTAGTVQTLPRPRCRGLPIVTLATGTVMGTRGRFTGTNVGKFITGPVSFRVVYGRLHG